MRKILIYSSFLISSLVVIAMFLTATTYAQLAFAVILYPALVYFGLRAFPGRLKNSKTKEPIVKIEPADIKKEENIEDVDRRGFLKVIGAAGLSFFLFSIFNRKAQVPFFGKVAGPGTTALEDVDGKKINPAQSQPTDGYRISEIDDNIITYYGFTNKDGEWFIMREDPDNGSFRYAKGDSNFPDKWAKHENLVYDYYSKVF